MISDGGLTPTGPAPGVSDPEVRHRPASTYSRYLGFAILGSLAPGVGMIAAGRRWLGSIVLGIWLGGFVGFVIAAASLGRSRLLALSSDSDALRLLAPGIVILAGFWLAAAVVSLYLLQPRRLSSAKRASGAFAVVVVMTLVVAPLGMAARYSTTHGELIERIFASSDQRSLTAPTIAPRAVNPWRDLPRVNVLLLGSDAADGREGVRPDTLIVASVDTRTGQTALLSVPRNLERVPFPETSPLHELYPFGYTGLGDRRNWMINAIYESVPAAHPEIFAGSAHPGADATKWAVAGALGIEIHYFAMVNLAGFAEVVDALGGITIDVHYRVPIGTRLDERTGRCTEARAWIEPGVNQRLDGARALWYARARCGPPPVTDDFNRMERQRCVIGAILDEVNPVTVMRHYERLAAAAEDIIRTDIPQQLLPAFVELAVKVQNAPVASLAFTDDVIASRSNPDFERIHGLAAEAISPAAQQVDASPSAPAPNGSPESTAGHAQEAEPPASEDPPGANGAPGADEAPNLDIGEPDLTIAQPLEAVC